MRKCDIASQIGLKADGGSKTIKEILQDKGLLTEEYLTAIEPNGMV